MAGSGTTATPAPAATEGRAPYVTPLVRKLAAQHEVDLNAVVGTGVGGRIRKQDVLAAAESQKAAAAAPAPAAQAPAAQAPAAPAAKAAPATPGEAAPATVEPAPSAAPDAARDANPDRPAPAEG